MALSICQMKMTRSSLNLGIEVITSFSFMLFTWITDLNLMVHSFVIQNDLLNVLYGVLEMSMELFRLCSSNK